MTHFQLFAALGLGLILVSLYGVSRRLGSSGSVQAARYPVLVLVTVGCVGLLLMLASVPGAFFQQPHWLTDKVYWLVERLIA
jgi:uncharacterized membrane protein